MLNMWDSTKRAERAMLAELEQAVRDAVMDAHVSALNATDIELRRSGDSEWPSPLNLMRNFTSNIARSRLLESWRPAVLQ